VESASSINREGTDEEKLRMCPGVLRKTGVSGIEAWRRKGNLCRPAALVGFHDGQGGAQRKTRDPKARMRKYYRVRNELQMLNELSRLAAIMMVIRPT
jgi:hypothetical protein